MTRKGALLTTHSDRNPLVVALREIGQEVIRCNFDKTFEHLPGCIGYYGNLFSEIKQPLAFLRLRRALTKLGIPYVFWNRDAPWNVDIKPHNKFFLRALQPVDLYLAHSLQNAGWFSKGAPIYFPNAARGAYCLSDLAPGFADASRWRYDISFFGAIGNEKRLNCRRRKAFLQAIRERLEQRGIALRWRIVDTVFEPLNLERQLELIRTTKINLNYGAMCDLPGNPSWGLPERVFGIPAAGGFLLTDWRESIPATFPDGSCDHFRTTDECVEKIVHYLDDADAHRNRAERLHADVLARHTYAARAWQLVDLLNRQPKLES